MSKTLLSKVIPVLVIALFALAIFFLRVTGTIGGSTGLNLESDMATPQYGAYYE